MFENSTIIMQVNDIYTNVNNNLIRSLSIGKTNSGQIQLKEFLLPKFEKKIIFELDNNNNNNNRVQIIERYNMYYKKSELNLKNNIKHGFTKNWNTRGGLTKIAFYNNGKIEGKYTEFYNELTPKVYSNYKNGNISKLFKYEQRHGTQKTFHKNGILKQKGRYKKNQPTGWHYYYDSFAKRINKKK